MLEEKVKFVAAKLPLSLVAAIEVIAKKSRRNKSVVMRAAVRLATPLLEIQPQLVRQLEAGVSPGDVRSLLQRAKAIADKNAVDVDLVLRAALRMGLFSFETAGDQMDANYLKAFDAGIMELPSFQQVFQTMGKAPAMGKLVDSAVHLAGVSDSDIEREAKAAGLPEKLQALNRPEKAQPFPSVAGSVSEKSVPTKKPRARKPAAGK